MARVCGAKTVGLVTRRSHATYRHTDTQTDTHTHTATYRGACVPHSSKNVIDKTQPAHVLERCQQSPEKKDVCFH